MRRVLSTLCAAIIGAALVVAPHDGAAQTPKERKEARVLADAGLAHFNGGRYGEAINSLLEAEKIIHAPPHLLYIARAQVKLGLLMDARETYRKLLDEQLPKKVPFQFTKAQQDGEKELAALEARIPKLALSLRAPPDAQVSVDGRLVADLDEPLLLDPGPHEVIAEAAGYQLFVKPVQLQATGDVHSLEIVMSPQEAAPEPADDPEPEGSWLHEPIPPLALIGVGAAGLIVGTVTGAMALGKAGDLRDQCPENPCPTENESLADEANTLATVSTVTFVVGGLVGAAGTAWLVAGILFSEDEDKANVLPVIGPGLIGVRGAF